MRHLQIQWLWRIVSRLLLNHMDAWGSTFIIATLALVINDALDRQGAVLIAALTVGYWLAFALNDYYDAPYDAADERKARRNFFVQHRPKRTAIGLVVVPVCAFLLLAFMPFGWRGMAALATSLFVMWAYSAPPLRFKSRPGFDLLVHAVFVETFPYLICLVLSGSIWTRLDVVMLIILFLSSLTAQLEQQLRDFKVDTHTVRTFATTVGAGKTMLLLRLTTGLLMLVAVVNVLNRTIPPFLAPFGLIALPAFAHRFLRERSRPRSEKLITLSALMGLLYIGFMLIFYAVRS